MSSFQHWLSKTFKPCCLVLCSDKAKSILAENNLTPAEFLRPLGDFRSKKVNIQFNEKDKELISLNDFFFDFYDNEQYKQISQDQVINYILLLKYFYRMNHQNLLNLVFLLYHFHFS